MLRAVIIDDEEAGIETLKILASRYPALIKIIGSTLKALEGIELIEDYKPDLVFLDITMPAMSGFDLLARLRFRDFKLVFTTAHRDYAIEAIRHKAFDYLLKPVSEASFKSCLDEIIKEQHKSLQAEKHSASSLVEVQVKDGTIYIQQKEIIRLEASRSYTVFHLDNSVKHVASRGLTEFEGRLDPRLFYRCHKSHIINLYKVRKFVSHSGFFALMSDGSMPDISKNHKDGFIERLKNI